MRPVVLLAPVLVVVGAALASPRPARAEAPAPAPPAQGAEPPAPTATAAAATKAADPVAERVEALREGVSLLEKADAARGRGNRSFAEQLFSSAELILGPDALATIAPRFREGAPPRVNTPLVQLPRDAAPQPATAGNSDDEHPEEKPQRGSLAGVLQVDGKPLTDGLGVITLEPASGKWKRRAPRQRVMEQRNRQFAPRLLAVPVGSTVTFPNYDPVYHNVFSTAESQPFDLGLYKDGQARSMKFDKPGIVAVGCNLHANMTGHIVVVGAPHYVITNAEGRFTFRSLEPGRYLLRAWSEASLQPVTQEVTIRPERGTVAINVKRDAPTGFIPDKFGTPRGRKP